MGGQSMAGAINHNGRWIRGGTIGLPVLAVMVSLWRLQPQGKDAGGFSTPRAMQHLQVIAREAHPVGSPYHPRVRDYLIEQFRAIGYEVRTQDAMAPLRYRSRQGPRVPISNVIAKRAGRVAGGKAVLLGAHYDSVRTGPGAADNGAAVAAMIEVARLMAQQPHRNDVIFLFSDGEELDLLGAREFVANDPAAREIGTVLNFDARGTSGPSIMFETSPGNAWLIGLLGRVDPHPVCNSLSYDLYKRMPNNTDFTVFREAGMEGLNFAFIGGYENYHTARDDLAHLDVRSLQHQGLQALALAEALAEMDLNRPPRAGDDVYFDVLSLVIVRYPQCWAAPGAVAAAVLALVVIGTGLRRRDMGVAGILKSLAVLAMSVVIASATGWCVWLMSRSWAPNRHVDLAITACVLLAVASTAGLAQVFKPGRVLEMSAAGLSVWAILNLAMALNWPGGSYLTSWPTILSATGLALCQWKRIGASAGARSMVLSSTGAAAMVLLSPVIYLSFVGLTMRLAWALVIPVVLGFWLLPQMAKNVPRGTSAAFKAEP